MTDLTLGIYGGVDTHLDVHVAAVVDQAGRLLETRSFPTTTAGYRALVAWMRAHGPLVRVGVEGTGSYGAGLARHLHAQDVAVVEVNRPEDAAGLERALEEHGIAADVTYLPALRTCAPGRFDEVDREVGLSLAIGEDLVRVTLPPGAVREGETFVMALSVVPFTDEQIAEVSEREGQRVVDGASSSVSAEVASGPVGPCEAVPAR